MSFQPPEKIYKTDVLSLSEMRCSSSPTYDGNDRHSASSFHKASSCFEPMRQSEIGYGSSPTSPTYGGNDRHSASSCLEPASPSISSQPPDKIHKTKVKWLSENMVSSTTYGGNDDAITYFEPQKELTVSTTGDQPSLDDTPEKKLTLFAMHLAIIEKSASALGKLAFIWATVVLLGGFASALKPKDFWFVTIILIVEGARLFSRSSELEWQHQSMRTLPAATYRWVFVLKIINHLLYWLQLFAAVVCVALSLMRLGQQDYGEDAEINEKSALNVFYGLALAEALMFLLEKGYWTWKIQLGKLVERVNEECELGPIGLVSLRRFFYDSYSKCIDGSIFNGLKMNLVSYAEELLDSDSLDEQIIGSSILKTFVESNRFDVDTLRKIGSSTSVIERLIEMLNWKDSVEKDIRCAASVIISKLALRKQNALRVAAIPGAMESIASLLHIGGRTPYKATPMLAEMYNDEDRIFTLNQTLNNEDELQGITKIVGRSGMHGVCLHESLV